MRVFGCLGYVLIPKKKQPKRDAKSRVGVFMGYEKMSKAYCVHDMKPRQVVVTRDVNFNETKIRLTALNKIDNMDDVLDDLDDLDIGEDK